MNYESKILFGLDKIHYCKDGIIKPILGALDIEINLEQPYQYAKKQGFDSIRFKDSVRGKGKLTLLGLTLEEQAHILGCEYENGELYIEDGFNPKPISLLFSRERADGSELYTVVYKCVVNNPSDVATTIQGEMNNETQTLEFDVLVDLNKKLTYFTLDTKIGNKDTVDDFFKELQYPSRAVR
ncbi:hypothetical protein SDC9_122027 [bioreactor metagenome]|uniref:Phage tail protein n=1 Tax=bioreactor metagenome TaxID=1076179 RepID=A0A645CDH8_9ZZZZ